MGLLIGGPGGATAVKVILPNGRSFCPGPFIVYHKNEKDLVGTLEHERGHFIDFLRNPNPLNYLIKVAIPSVSSDGGNPYYYCNPWEYSADRNVGIKRTYCTPKQTKFGDYYHFRLLTKSTERKSSIIKKDESSLFTQM